MPSITVLCPDDEAVKRMVNEMLIAWNETMGQYFNMEPLSRTELERRVSSGNYDMALISPPGVRGRAAAGFVLIYVRPGG